MSCIVEKFATCSVEVDGREVLQLSLELLEFFRASPYDVAPLAVAFGADPREVKKVFGLEVSGSFKKPVWSFMLNYGRRFSYEKVERALLRLYRAQRGPCMCPVGPVAPLGGGKYITQRPYGIYLCDEGNCIELSPEPITLYEHPSGCMLYNPPLVLTGQQLTTVAGALKQLKVAEPDIVASFLLPGLCKDLWGVVLV